MCFEATANFGVGPGSMKLGKTAHSIPVGSSKTKRQDKTIKDDNLLSADKTVNGDQEFIFRLPSLCDSQVDHVAIYLVDSLMTTSTPHGPMIHDPPHSTGDSAALHQGNRMRQFPITIASEQSWIFITRYVVV